MAYQPTTTGGAPVDKTKHIVQIVVTFLCGGNIVALIFAILGLVRADTDPVEAAKWYKWGWIAFAIGLVLWIIGIILYFIFIAAMVGTAGTTSY
ncbi:hypothetical protein [Brachybacterium huguangmaarense]